jgi:Na+-transporting methylmalonyl-CoA/oxaloacetate decarboxylase gamma subunit
MALKVAISGMAGVFIGLAILCICLIFIQKIVAYFNERKNRPKKNNNPAISDARSKKQSEISGETIAALATSIYLDLCSLDEKKKLLTIQQVTKPYSPWINSGRIMMISANNNLMNSRK